MSTIIEAPQTDLILPSEWDHDIEMLNDEELSATSHEEASKVFEQWQTDHDLDIMEVDEQIGSNLLDEDIFEAPCLSPTGPLEELVYMNLDDIEDDRFFAPCLDDESASTSSLDFPERYQATLKKLAESMQRSQETRKSLSIKTEDIDKYSRSKIVNSVLTSIEKSSQQIQGYLKNIQSI
jgi:hypothetical protein